MFLSAVHRFTVTLGAWRVWRGRRNSGARSSGNHPVSHAQIKSPMRLQVHVSTARTLFDRCQFQVSPHFPQCAPVVPNSPAHPVKFGALGVTVNDDELSVTMALGRTCGSFPSWSMLECRHVHEMIARCRLIRGVSSIHKGELNE